MSQPHRLIRNRTNRDGTGAYETADGVTIIRHAQASGTTVDGATFRKRTMIPMAHFMGGRKAHHFPSVAVVGQAQHPQVTLVDAYRFPRYLERAR
jgi:hypothetical protein